MLAAPCTTWPPVGNALATGDAQAKPTQAIDKTNAPMKTDTAEPGATAAPAGDSPDDLPWLQACSPTATRQPECSEKTVLKQRAFIGDKKATRSKSGLIVWIPALARTRKDEFANFKFKLTQLQTIL
jgi:hypothetical protein